MKSERVAVGDREITKRQRYREIVAVLARHGFGVVDDRWATSQKTSPSRPSHTGVRAGNRGCARA